MGQKLTKGFKETTCKNCGNCDVRALRKGWNHCKSEFKMRNGHCLNFVAKKGKKKEIVDAES